jgi:hypothetical protein
MSTIRLSLRETRLVVERVLLVAGLPAGMVGPVRDVILDAEALGLGGLAYLRDEWAALEQADVTDVSADGSGEGVIVVDCHDQPACVVSPAILDLAVGAVHRHRTSILRVRRVRDAGFLGALVGTAERHRVRLVVVPQMTAAHTVAVGACGPGREALQFAPAAAPEVAEALILGAPMQSGTPRDPLVTLTGATHLARVTREGLSVPGDLWWHLFHKSNEALSPDSSISRQHAGASVLDEAGRIIGDTDDDQDLGSERAA